MKARIIAILGALTLAIGFGIVSGQAAYAVGPVSQYCATSSGGCMNAYNEGPYIDAYHSNVVNNNFSAFKNTDGYETIEYLGPGPHQHQCISDYGNDQHDARAALGGLCDSGQISWGANFELKACDNGDSGDAFWNVHWNGWLTPNSDSNGSPFYLNSNTKTCYKVLGAG